MPPHRRGGNRDPVQSILAIRCIHERSVREHFGEGAFHEGRGPIFGFPLIILGFWNRSGSNLLADHMRSTGRFFGFDEALNHEVVTAAADGHRIGTFSEYIRRLVIDRSGGAPGFGVKASSGQTAMLFRLGIDRMFAGVRIIHCMRRDIVGQAVSMQIARQTQQWTSDVAARPVCLAYDEREISADLIDILNARMAFALIEESLGVPTLEVFYEDLAASPQAVIETVASFLVTDLGGWQAGQPALEKQANIVNADHRARYCGSVRRVLSGGELTSGAHITGDTTHRTTG